MVTILSIGRHSGRHAHRTGWAGPAAIHGTEALAAYLEHGGAIFRHNPLRQAATPGGLIRPTYSPLAAARCRPAICTPPSGISAPFPGHRPAGACAALRAGGERGIIKRAVPISGVMLNASSATVDYHLRALLGPQSYLRC